jgi:hypothetical protein
MGNLPDCVIPARTGLSGWQAGALTGIQMKANKKCLNYKKLNCEFSLAVITLTKGGVLEGG